MGLLVDLATQTGRHVGPYLSVLLAALETAELVPTELQAQVGAARPTRGRTSCSLPVCQGVGRGAPDARQAAPARTPTTHGPLPHRAS